METTGEDIPEGFETNFWKLVFLLNVGPVALVLAVLQFVFRGTSNMVWASLVVSAVSFFFAGRTYLAVREQIEDMKTD